MTRIIECVPNFSEGRDEGVLAKLEEAIVGVPGVHLLDVQADRSHHRSVFTFIGNPDGVLEAAFRASRTARDLIDLTRHRGEHPRMGATDVVPLVPVQGVSMDDCVALARRLGERIGRELEIPVFLYARAATGPERESLPNIRKGEFEGLRDAIGRDPGRTPDFGPHRIHPTAGATAVGARPFLVAYNIYLDTGDVSVAAEIAKKIRTSSGGLPAVQAKGFEVDGLVQVSINLLDIDQTSPARAFAAVEAEATGRGVRIVRSEIVGLIPERALHGAGAAALKLGHAPEPHLLEAKVRSVLGPPLDGWLDQVAAATPTPGGGSAAALAGAVAGALVAMVGRLTVGRKAYASVDAEFGGIVERADALRLELRRLVDQDAAAYDAVGAACRLPKSTEIERDARARAVDQALLAAARVPLEVARKAVEVMRLARRAGEAGNKSAASDAAVAAVLAHAAAKGAARNVETNVAALSRPEAGQALLRETADLLREADETAAGASARA